jgi:hypothetical protein
MLAAATALAACQQDDSILVVEVGGDLNLRPAQMSVTVSAGGHSKAFLVPPTPAPFYLPTSFTVELDRSITGPLTMAIEVFDDAGYGLASGATTQKYINTGGQTVIAVTVTTAASP